MDTGLKLKNCEIPNDVNDVGNDIENFNFELDENSQDKLSDSEEGYEGPKSNEPIYKEADTLLDDEFIYCLECKKNYEGDCPKHPLTPVYNKLIPHDGSVKDRAYKSLPVTLQIKYSEMSRAGKGVFALDKIPKGVRFGPYEGTIRTVEDGQRRENGYCWKVCNGQFSHYVDGFDLSVSNWMRFVNCAPLGDEHNLVAFQYGGEIYYRTTEKITFGQELLVRYGNAYPGQLGITKTKKENVRNSHPAGFINILSIIDCDESKLGYDDDHPYRNSNAVLNNKLPSDGSVRQRRYESLPSCLTLNTSIMPDIFATEPISRTRQIGLKRFRLKDDDDNETQLAPTRPKSDGDAESLVDPRTRFRCLRCQQRFKSPDRLKDHFRKSHSDFYKGPVKKFACNMCLYTTNMRGNLKIHVQFHTYCLMDGEESCSDGAEGLNELETRFRCLQCSMLSANQENVKIHFAKMHPYIYKGPVKQYACNMCLYTTNHRGNLKTHVRCHTYCSKGDDKSEPKPTRVKSIYEHTH